MILSNNCMTEFQLVEIMVGSATETPAFTLYYCYSILETSEEPELTGNSNITLNSVEIFTCISSGGFPPAQFQWFIEEGNNIVNITDESFPGNGYSDIVYVAKKEDNGKNITCIVKQVEGAPEQVTRKKLTILCKFCVIHLSLLMSVQTVYNNSNSMF